MAEGLGVPFAEAAGLEGWECLLLWEEDWGYTMEVEVNIGK